MIQPAQKDAALAAQTDKDTEHLRQLQVQHFEHVRMCHTDASTKMADIKDMFEKLVPVLKQASDAGFTVPVLPDFPTSELLPLSMPAPPTLGPHSLIPPIPPVAGAAPAAESAPPSAAQQPEPASSCVSSEDFRMDDAGRVLA